MKRVTNSGSWRPCLTEHGSKVHATLDRKMTYCGHPVSAMVHESKLMTCEWCQCFQERRPTPATERIRALQKRAGRATFGEAPVADLDERRRRKHQ